VSVHGGIGWLASRRTWVAAALGGPATAIVLLFPSLRIGYRNLGAHVALETTATLIGGLVAVLLYGRYRRTHLLRDLLLVCAMTLLSLTALVYVARPSLIGDGSTAAAWTWACLVIRLAGVVLILAAALVPPDRVHRVTRPARAVLRVAAVLAAVSILVLLLDRWLPGLVRVGAGIGGPGRPKFESQPLLLAVRLISLPCYAIAAVAFTRGASRTGDDLVGWFGAAAAIGAWAQINYLLSPTQYTEWLSLGDVLRLGFLGLLFVGALREIQDYWAAQGVAAAHYERRRLARDLHDGVVQELGYIRSRASRQHGSQEGLAAEIVAAAERALGEARRSIDALSEQPDEDLSATLQRAAVEVGDRYDLAVHLSLDFDVQVIPAQREALVRIMREAVSNAARHAAPDAVWITLTSGALTVRDDGHGFEPTSVARPGSFGLIGMRERATSIGAVVEITSSLGGGTRVMATW
jgi:signal transduction histidine kinase